MTESQLSLAVKVEAAKQSGTPARIISAGVAVRDEMTQGEMKCPDVVIDVNASRCNR